ncbi:MAG: ABC transporter permease [Tissierellia bacterium]|nr:ABC transporter permease [Tissierellia bacterium]
MSGEIINALGQTLYMVSISTLLAVLIGLPTGIILLITEKGHISENLTINRVLDFITNILRSIPFIILLVTILPLTRLIVGKSYGTAASIVPLAISAIPFFARVAESSLREVDNGLIESSLSMGASNLQVITRVLIPESLPSLVQGITLTVINLIGYSAMAGAIGGGGLGDIAIRYGYHRSEKDVILYCVVVIVLLVQTVQIIGNKISKSIDHK